MVDLSPKTIRRLVRERRFPRPVRAAERKPRWYAADIRAYLEGLRLGILIDGRPAKMRGSGPPVKSTRKGQEGTQRGTRGEN